MSRTPAGSAFRIGSWPALLLALTGCANAPQPPAASPSYAPQSTLPATAAKVPAMDVRQLGWPVWVGIVCDDLHAQRRFYRDVLGFTESNVSEGSVWFIVEGKLLELFARSDRPQYARRGVAIGFVVGDIRAARATLIERGVVPVSEIEGGPDQHWAYFKDAEGNLFEIVEPPPPR